ncbi:sequence-specific DNA binding transcription factor ATNDX [Tasmannia lanceolata]|uniref:sequence-specific DNA binding transcription factor ATNDX n=1 Tax=Tasmannia lanceolata TaxID=3420 RepID=UPI004064265E
MMRHVKEEFTCNNDHVIDFNSAVEELHRLGSQELTKLLRDSDNFSIQLSTENGSLVQIDMERLAWSLPLHLIAVLGSSGGDDTHLRYLLRGARLLHSLSDLASRHTRLEQILLDEVKVTEQILDLVFYMLVVLARYEQEDRVGTSLPLLHSTLVACSLHLLTGYISLQWPDLVHVLLVHPKVDIFMDVSFDAVRVDINFFQMKLSELSTEVFHKKLSITNAESTAQNLSQQCEASLQFLQSLCQQKMFRERILRNKELCKNGGILSLAQAILRLNVPSLFNESPTIMAAVSRLKSKILSILLQLCETESISYLDEVASTPRSMHLAKSVALEVLELLKAAFSREPKQINDCLANRPNTNPKGLVLLNSMRLADIFSDDSNFRAFIMSNITQVLADILALPHDDFLTNWCSTVLPVTEEDATLEYDPFLAAGAVLVSLAVTDLSAPNLMNESNAVCSFILNNMPPVSHAQQRTSFLVKIIANLHCFVPNICEEQEKDQFFNKFLECLQMEPPKSSSRLSFSDAQKASTISKNLCSLLDHAVSLIPTLLNEEDVHLLSVFFEQLQALITPAQSVGNPIEDSANKDAKEIQDRKSEYSCLGFPDFDDPDYFRDPNDHAYVAVNDDHQLSEEAQSTGVRLSMRRTNASAVEEAPDIKDKNGNVKEETSESSMFQDVEQFKARTMPIDPPDDSIEPVKSRRKDKNATSRGTSGCLKEIDKDRRSVETSGSDVSSTKEKNSGDLILEKGEIPKLKEHIKETGFGGAQENEKIEVVQSEERQPRKRKRNIMNEKQITLIERALLNEPEMQRNAALLQSWADKLSLHGSELTSSQLKNWLNNRKARLARAAREARAPSEGETIYPDKASGQSLAFFYDSPESAGEEYYAPSTTARGNHQSTSKLSVVTRRATGGETSEMPHTEFVDFATQRSIQMNFPPLRYVLCEPGQYVLLIDGEGKEVGKGKVYQVEGRWLGQSLEEAVCIVDVLELKVERWTRLPHPSESAGMTFDEAEAKSGVMRVAWDANKLILIP